MYKQLSLTIPTLYSRKQVLYPTNLYEHHIWIVIFLLFVIGNFADMLRFIYHKFGTIYLLK